MSSVVLRQTYGHCFEILFKGMIAMQLSRYCEKVVLERKYLRGILLLHTFCSEISEFVKATTSRYN